MSRAILFLCDDLIFTSKVSATARAAGGTCKSARDGSAFFEALAAGSFTEVVIDLATFTGDVSELIGQVRKCTSEIRIIVYGPHVNAEPLQAARDSGAEVFTRGKFVTELERLLGASPQAAPSS